MVEINKLCMYMTTKPVVSEWECTTPILPSPNSLTNALNMPWSETTPYTWPPKILLWKNMMEDSKIFSKRFMITNINLNLNNKDYGMNTDSSTIWSHRWLRVKEALFGPVKTMTEMFNLISLLKDTDHWDWWPQSCLLPEMLLKLKPLMVPLPDITDSINKEKKPPLTLLLLSSHGLEDYSIEVN